MPYYSSYAYSYSLHRVYVRVCLLLLDLGSLFIRLIVDSEVCVWFLYSVSTLISLLFMTVIFIANFFVISTILIYPNSTKLYPYISSFTGAY